MDHHPASDRLLASRLADSGSRPGQALAVVIGGPAGAPAPAASRLRLAPVSPLGSPLTILRLGDGSPMGAYRLALRRLRP